MIHIFKHKDGTFDRATVRKGKYIHGSNQHYERKRDVIRSIISDLRDVDGDGGISPFLCVKVQDDTGEKSVLCTIHEIKEHVRICEKQPKKMKKYIPNAKTNKK